MIIEIVSDLVKALNNYRPSSGELIHHGVKNAIQKSSSVWECDYPIAVVHKKVRIKEKEVLQKFEENALLDAKGETPNLYTQEQFTFLKREASHYIKTANLICMYKEDEALPTFEPKRENDYWKKLVNTGNFKAVVEFSSFGHNSDICTLEKIGRDIMRSRKEVHTVRELGFVWIAHVHPLMNVDALFQLYFGENYMILNHEEDKYYIGWSSKLQEINMRNFICPPTA